MKEFFFIVGFIVLLGAAGASDSGAPMSRWLPLALAGIAIGSTGSPKGDPFFYFTTFKASFPDLHLSSSYPEYF